MSDSRRKHPIKKGISRRQRQMLESKNVAHNKRQTKEQRGRQKGIRQKIKGKRILLSKVARMSAEELVACRAEAAVDPKFTPKVRLELSQLDVEQFRHMWMSGLRKAIRLLREHIGEEE